MKRKARGRRGRKKEVRKKGVRKKEGREGEEGRKGKRKKKEKEGRVSSLPRHFTHKLVRPVRQGVLRSKRSCDHTSVSRWCIINKMQGCLSPSLRCQ